MNLKIYSNFELNQPVAYFPFWNLCTFCMHGSTRKQPIKRLVLVEVISRSILPEQSLTICNISHDWKENKFFYTVIYRLTMISFNSHGNTCISDKMHGLMREVDTRSVRPTTQGQYKFNGNCNLSNNPVRYLMFLFVLLLYSFQEKLIIYTRICYEIHILVVTLFMTPSICIFT